ncbi:ATP-binding cassette domain-containing protein, partial [Escherichia coli]|uniref:ATP-binding cassette domain-containing protein n=1 Tax=Escherichia coli TaxID=562 RepID=UPI0002A24702
MPYLLEMKNITKTFGSVKAIDNVSLRLNAGEIVSLCGENGSGKSTLMKVLCGIYPHGSYEGEKFLRELCEVDLLVLDEIGIQRETKNEQVVLHQIVDRRTAS